MGMFDEERKQLGLKQSGSSSSKNKTKSIFAEERANISKPKIEPTFKEQQMKFGRMSADPSQSPMMQAIDHYGKSQPVTPTPTQKSGWNGIVDNPIGRGIGKGLNTLDVLSQDIAKFATPDAPMFTKDGKLDPNMTARQQFMMATPQKTTGSAGLDKALNVGGQIGSLFTPIGTGGAFINDIGKGASALLASKGGQIAENVASKLGSKGANAINPMLNQFGINLSNNLASKSVQTALRGGTLGAGFGALEPFRTGDGNLSDVPKSIAENAAMFAGGDALLPFIGAAGGAAKSAISKSFDTLFSKVKPVESAPKVGIQNPEINFTNADAAMPEMKIQKADGLIPKAPEQPIKGQQITNIKTGDELKFAQTVKQSENTNPELLKAMQETPMTGARTSDVLNRQEAAKMLETHGTEGLYSKLLAKKNQFSAAENTAAQVLAKHFSTLGGEENLSKAIELVSKTAKGGREMGQAIQALSQWNKLDAEGALLLGERQLNRGIKDTEEWQKLTPAQGAPLVEAAQRIGTAAETKNLADEVLSIVTNKSQGEALTEAEKATVKQFQDQVKLINEKGKGILFKPKVDRANETIKKVSQIEPKARSRDQVVSFLDAKAELARKRIAASRNIGFAAINKGNPVIDYAIIGASHIAKGVVKLSDFTEAMVRDFGDSVKPHIDEAFNKATNMFRKENGLPTIEHLDRVVSAAVKNERFTAEEAKQFKAWASEIGHMSDEFKREATQDLQTAMKELGDSTLGEKLATIQTGAQLLNAVTIGRNVIGNAALIAAEKVNKVSAVPIDWAMSKLTGERTIQFSAKNQEKMLKNLMQGTSSGYKGVSPSGTLDSYGIHPNVFGKKNPLRFITKMLGASMQGFDHAAYRQAYGDVLATYGEQLGKAQGLSKEAIGKKMPQLIEKLDQRIFDLADEAGRYATFQDDTLLSQGAEMLKRGLNKITDLPAQKLVSRGLLPKKLSTEGFGVGDIVLKYAKTPANLVMRAIDYSPIGFVRATMELLPLVANKAKFNQFQATRALSRAITGSLGLTGMGYALADAGILTGSASMDKDTRSIQEQSGQGAYKVNWSALYRYIESGLDKDAAKFQKGDHLMDYQWLQPAAISVAMGVNANRAVNDKKNGADITGWQVFTKGLLGGIQTVLENPMVQGLSGVVDAGSDILKRQDTTKAKGLFKGVPATFVPTVLNQWRASTDNKQRETFSNDLFTEMGNLIKNKIPGLSKSLPVSYDSLGNERERIQGGKENTVGQYLTAFFSPARMTEYQVSDEAKLVLDLMNQSGDQNVLPRIAPKTFHVKQGKNMPDMKVNLDATQFSKLQKNLGEMVKDKLGQKSDYLSNPSVSLDKKVDAVKKVLTEVGSKVRENIGIEMGFKKKDIKS